jgi:hypothetical protein
MWLRNCLAIDSASVLHKRVCTPQLRQSPCRDPKHVYVCTLHEKLMLTCVCVDQHITNKLDLIITLRSIPIRATFAPRPQPYSSCSSTYQPTIDWVPASLKCHSHRILRATTDLRAVHQSTREYLQFYVAICKYDLPRRLFEPKSHAVVTHENRRIQYSPDHSPCCKSSIAASTRGSISPRYASCSGC